MVTDAASLRPVSDARVFIAGTGVEAFTDIEGSYRISEVPVGEVEIRLERLGYAPGSSYAAGRGRADLDGGFQLTRFSGCA